jgi:hypothetical protein
VRAIGAATPSQHHVMPRLTHIITAALVLLVAAIPLVSQAQPGIELPYWRPYDQRGINVFEAPKQDTVPYQGMQLRWGVAFAQQFQGLSHRNTPTVVDGEVVNPIIEIGPGFNLATANLNLDAVLAPGVRVNLVTYLSSRHHPEAWVKGGYLQVDEMPFLRLDALDNLFQYVTLRLGHFEINYGDAHFRRTDNANAMWNPFVGNYIMDSFTTEIGGEVYVQHAGFLGMVGITGGEISGRVDRPDDRAPSIFAKVGVDRQVNPDLRVRLTGSAYTSAKSINNTLYGGDRAGSRYYLVLEAPGASPVAAFTSGRINPGMRDKITAFQINPFVKFHGLELFGIIESASGRAANETEDRTWNQYAAEAIYRFLPNESLYLGARYNRVEGPLASGTDVSVDRLQVGAGWFPTPQILLKAEYVTQKYTDFPAPDRLHEAEFNGFMIEGVIAF